jgi:hypothetical protein
MILPENFMKRHEIRIMSYLKTESSMKNIITFLNFILLPLLMLSQAPHSFNYQAVLRDSGGHPMVNQEVAVRVSLLRDSSDGIQVFQETHQATTNEFGLIQLQIGSQSSLSGINWLGHSWFLQIHVNNQLMGVSQLQSVPYALHALTSADTFSGNYMDLTNTPDLSGFLSQETDPFFIESPAGSISDAHISKWEQAHGWGDHSQAGYLWLEQPQAGEMVYFDGQNWQRVAAGQTGQTLSFCYGKPSWGPCPQIASVTTEAISAVTMNTATSGGEVSTEGDAPVTARGVCWSIHENPTLANQHTIDGSGTGTFISQISGLTPGTTYYVRAYATNNISTAYGQQLVFTSQESEVTLPSIEFNGTLFIHPTDNSSSLRYGSISIETQATSHTDGQNNTQLIVNTNADHNNGNYAARLCSELNAFGYSDWYLPAKDELNALYLNHETIGGFSASGYWSSTELNAVNAFNQYFNTGYSGTTVKTNNFRVRCVRRN